MTPPGYERLLLGHAVAVARSDLAAAIRSALVSADGSRATLHEFASRQPAARALAGRGTAWAVALPAIGSRVVVRHNRHGGVFATLTRDRFVAPTRAPRELEASLELRRLGVPTPEVLAYAVYPPGGVLQRCDVVTGEIGGGAGRDLADVLVSGTDDERAAALALTARLVGSMSRVGARHHDLNAKNVLVADGRAHVLDVDRVVLDTAVGSALDGNLARLARSLRKWRDRFGARLGDDDIAKLEHSARQAASRG